MSVVSLLGRILLSAIFILSGFHKIGSWAQTASYMEQYGMTMVPLLLLGAIVCEVAGGVLVLIGYQTRLGASLLILFLIPATYIFHPFWTIDDPQAAQLQMIMFMKNLAIMGGLMHLFASGPGEISLDHKERV